MRREGHSKLHGRPLDENGAIEFFRLETHHRIELFERIMKLPYIKATRNAEVGEERFVARDDVITAFHEFAKEVRNA